MKLPDPRKLVMTIGVDSKFGTKLGLLYFAVRSEYDKQPDEDTTGGNDKFFFSFMFFNTKLFAAANEVGGLTIMLPEEY